jgi:hypothetical protein
MPEEELKELQNEFAALHAKYAARVQERAQQGAAMNGSVRGQAPDDL